MEASAVAEPTEVAIPQDQLLDLGPQLKQFDPPFSIKHSYDLTDEQLFGEITHSDNQTAQIQEFVDVLELLQNLILR